VIDILITRNSSNAFNLTITFHAGTTVEVFSETFSGASYTTDIISQLRVTATSGIVTMWAGTVMYIPSVIA